MPNGRCRMHGGTNPGPPRGNTNALKHGIYSRKLSIEEMEIIGSIELGSVDNEIRMIRIRLMRAMGEERKANGQPELRELTLNTGGGASTPSEILKSTVRDYSAEIEKMIARIESLERTRVELLKGGTQGGGDDLPDSRTFEYVVVDGADGDAKTK